MNDELKGLIETAKEIASENNCCKYSKYTVGAALMTEDNKIFKGFNIENEGIQSICAERVALSNALINGARKFKCIVIEGKKINEKNFSKTLPCGYCRQFIREYTDDNFLIYTYDDNTKELFSYKITELLPENFKF